MPLNFYRSFQDPSFSLHLHDKLQVPNSSRQAWNERDSCCDVCGTHLTQLKQEAVCMALPLEQWDLSPTSSPTTLFQRYVSQPPPGVQEVQGGPEPVDCATTTAPPSHPTLHSTQRASASPNKSPNPSPSHRPYHLSHRSPSGGQTSSGVPSNKQPQKAGHRLGSKPSFLGLGGGDRRNGSPGSGKAADSQQQPVSGPHTSSSTSGHSSTSGTAEPLQTIQLNRTEGGVSLDPNQVSYLHQCVCVIPNIKHLQNHGASQSTRVDKGGPGWTSVVQLKLKAGVSVVTPVTIMLALLYM